MDSELVKFLGWQGSYARFQIRREKLPNGNIFKAIIVSHEGEWTKEESMLCHGEFCFYENVQNKLGRGLIFKEKGYIPILNRSFFRYDFMPFMLGREYILAVPATGEEIKFEIYGVDEGGALVLLCEREL